MPKRCIETAHRLVKNAREKPLKMNATCVMLACAWKPLISAKNLTKLKVQLT